jgi:hypothetical protein
MEMSHKFSVEVVFWYHDISTNFDNFTIGNQAYDILKKVIDMHRITGTVGALSFKDFHSTTLGHPHHISLCRSIGHHGPFYVRPFGLQIKVRRRST